MSAPQGVELALAHLTAAARIASAIPSVRELARRLTEPHGDRRRRVEAIAGSVRGSVDRARPRDPTEAETLTIPFLRAPNADADEVSSALATLLMAAGVRCRIVALRYDRSWTCLVEYEADDGSWAAIDPLRQTPYRAPDERVTGPESTGGAP